MQRKGEEDEDTAVVYKISADDQRRPFSNPHIPEYIGRAMMNKNKDKGSMKFQAKQFPDEDSDEDEPDYKPQKMVTRPMVAFAATVVCTQLLYIIRLTLTSPVKLEVAIRDYINGYKLPVSLKEEKIAPWYQAHDSKIAGQSKELQQVTCAWIYKEAK